MLVSWPLTRPGLRSLPSGRVPWSNPRRSKYFKMKEVNGQKEGQFVGLSGDERREKVLRLVNVINKYAGADFTMTIPVKYFNMFLIPVLPEKYRFPYLWLFNAMLTAMASYEFHAGEGRTMIFTFDEQKQFLSKALALYERVKSLPPFNEHRHLVQEVKKGNDQIDLPLQAADLLAGQVRLFLEAPKPKVLSQYVMELKSVQRFSYNHVFDAPQLLEMAHNIEKWSGRW